jgi:hypothetical protein
LTSGAGAAAIAGVAGLAGSVVALTRGTNSVAKTTKNEGKFNLEILRL